MRKRIYLSAPHTCGLELDYIKEAFESNWIAPLGPHIEAFEKEFCAFTGAPYGVALSSGTAALHLALILAGVQEGDEVICSSFTFAGSAFPITYLKAKPIFIDCDEVSWNMDPQALEDAILDRIKMGKRPKAIILVHLYGQSADIDPILSLCSRYEITLIEDAAESVGTLYKGKHTGTFGQFGIFSFNGNKIMTTSGGGFLVSESKSLVDRARYLSTQAREPEAHYEHVTIGYNYRMSNICAAIGRGQLTTIKQKVKKKREFFEYYKQSLSSIPEISLMPEPIFSNSNCWLTCIIINSKDPSLNREVIRKALEKENIETRPLWKPLHLQPVFQKCPFYGSGVSESLFDYGLCLPSGTSMQDEDLELITSSIKTLFQTCTTSCC